MVMNVHGDNITQKENHRTKYRDEESKRFLREIKEQYVMWKVANEQLKGPFEKKTDNELDILSKRVELFVAYKDFIDQQKYAEKFDSRSNLHSTVLEEFIYYLFRDLVDGISSSALIGKAHTFKDIFFLPPNFKEMIKSPHVQIERKDHDFVIGVNILSRMRCSEQLEEKEELFQIPAIAIECKTYLDKTMLEGSSTAAEQLKVRNPNSVYIVVAEWLKLTESINLRKYKVDKIFILRKQKNTDREYRFLQSYEKKPIYLDVVKYLYNYVREHLILDWEGGIAQGLERGVLI